MQRLAVRARSARCTRARQNVAAGVSHKELTSTTTNEKLLPSAASHGGRADKG